MQDLKVSVIPNRALERRGIVQRNFASDPSSFQFKYECFICNCKLRCEKNAINHIDIPHHLQHTNRFKKYYKIIPPLNSLGTTSLSCNLCNITLNWQEVIEHCQSHNVTPWLKPNDLHRTFFRHFISEHQHTIYHCNLCNYTYGNWFNMVEHIKEPKHLKNWNHTSAPTANYALYENTLRQFFFLVTNRVFIGETKPYHCFNCNLSFENFVESYNHRQGIEHQSLCSRFLTEISEFKSEIPESLEWIKKSVFMVIMKNKIYCKICDIYMSDINEIDPHMENHKPEHVDEIFNDNKSEVKLENSNSEALPCVSQHSQKPSIPLSECELTIPDYLKWVISAHKVIVQKKALYCAICKKNLTNNSAVECHLKKHLFPDWQDYNLPTGIPRDAETARLQEVSEQAELSGIPIILGTAKRCALSPDNSEQNKMQKVENYLGTKPPFKNVGNSIQILPSVFKTDNNLSPNKRAPLLMTPSTSGIIRFPASVNKMNTNHSSTLVNNSRFGGLGLLGNCPPFLNTSFSPRNIPRPPLHNRPNLIDLMNNIPPLMSQPATIPIANTNPPILPTPVDKIPLNIPLVNNHPINNHPVSQQKQQSSKIQKPSKKNLQNLPSHNPLLNTSMMIKLHKANYLFFTKNGIYEMSPEKKRRIILSSQLSFFVKYSADYYIYCVVCEKSILYNLQNVFEHWCSSEHIEYLTKMEEDDRKVKDHPNQLSCLALSKEFMMKNQSTGADESSSKEYMCCACNVAVRDLDALLVSHFQSEEHLINVRRFRRHSEEMCKDLFPLVESSWYSIEKYTCWPCQKIISNELPYAEHLESKKHLSTLQAMSDEKKKKYFFDSCAVCGILWFGDQDEYPKHCYKDAIHKELTRNIEDRIDYLPEEASNLCSSPETTIAELVKEADRVLQDQGRKSELIRSLELAVGRKFPNAKAHPFGSRITGLGFKNSDIDIFLDCGGFYNGQFSHAVDLIDRIHRCLELDSQAWSVESVIETSRIPIIKVYHSHSQLKCDVSFTSGLSVENTKLLKIYVDAYPPCREMILFIKKWLAFCNLTGSRNITSYAISWLVIFYLQLRNILPSVASLMKGNPKPLIISGWQVGARSFSVNKMSSPLTTKELLKGFFNYYAGFDYRFNVACPLLGLVKSKKEFLYLPLLPDEMKSYVELITTETDPEFFHIDTPMCIQDPYDLSHNLTKGVKKVNVNRFRKLCGKTAKLLSDK